MEKLGYHRNLVRHMVVTNHFHDISATYHLLNDRFTRKLKSGAQTLASPIPISADSSRRSSITTGVVEPDHIPGERGSSPKLMSVGNRGSSTLSHRRGSLPPYIQLCRPSGRSAAGSPCLAEASETEETEEQSSKPKSRFLELPPDRKLLLVYVLMRYKNWKYRWIIIMTVNNGYDDTSRKNALISRHTLTHEIQHMPLKCLGTLHCVHTKKQLLRFEIWSTNKWKAFVYKTLNTDQWLDVFLTHK